LGANTWLSNNNNIQCLFDGAMQKKGIRKKTKNWEPKNKKQHCQMSLAFADVARYLLTSRRTTRPTTSFSLCTCADNFSGTPLAFPLFSCFCTKVQIDIFVPAVCSLPARTKFCTDRSLEHPL